jgi:uncharacterized oxidoreductase
VINGMFTIVVDPRRLGTQAEFEREALAFVEWLKQSPPAPGTQGVMLAGEPERKARRQREADGIALDEQTWAEIVQAGKKVGAPVG